MNSESSSNKPDQPTPTFIGKRLFYAWDGNNKMRCVVSIDDARELEGALAACQAELEAERSSQDVHVAQIKEMEQLLDAERTAREEAEGGLKVFCVEHVAALSPNAGCVLCSAEQRLATVEACLHNIVAAWRSKPPLAWQPENNPYLIDAAETALAASGKEKS